MTVGHAKPLLIVGLGLTGASVLRFCAARGLQADATDNRDAPPDVDHLRARYPDSHFALGTFAAPRGVDAYEAVVLSPGISPSTPFVAQLREAGLPVIGDIELFAQTVEAPVIAITGSNGKSTTTALLGAMADAAGIDAGVGGNLGTPALDLLESPSDLFILELSSFQLEVTSSLAAVAATMLNLSEDHLDRHGSMEAYGAAKARIYRHCGTAVINRADEETKKGSELASHRVSFALDAAPTDADYGILHVDGRDWLAAGTTRLVPADQIALRGSHNQANALAALALAEAASIPRAACLDALEHFTGLPHRCRLVHEGAGVQWLDDSKATNVGAALAALSGMNGPLIWLGGGQAKGQDFGPLVDALADRARLAIVFGQDADLLGSALAAAGVDTRRVRTLDEAAAEAAQAARSGETVLLSPACASLDQFPDYRARGDAFARLAKEVAS